MIICLHQLFHKPSPMIQQPDGMGDCTICKHDTDNINCIGYKPITIQEYDVVERNKDDILV